MKKRLVALVLMLVMVMTTLAACSNGSANGNSGGSDNTTDAPAAGDEKNTTDDGAGDNNDDNGEVIELEFWGWWSSEARKPYIEEMVEGFNTSQNKYHVTYIDIPFGDIFTKNIAQIAAGNPCDIIANSMEEVKFRANQEQVESLDQFLSDDVKGAFYEQYIDACTGDDGSVYALPLSVDTRAIYYNKAHFEEADINPDDIKTWDDLEAAARKLDIGEEGNWERVGYLPILGNGGVDTLVINANGGQGWFIPETSEPTANTDTNKEVLKWIRKQVDHYGQSKFDELSAVFESGMVDPFASGVLSMLTQTSAYQAALKQNAPDLDYGVIQFPEFKAGTGHTVNGGGFVLEIPKGAKNPEGSYEFIKYVTSKETQDFLSTSIGDFSARNDFDESTEFFQNPINQDLAKCLEETVTIIVPNDIKGYQDIINPLVEEGSLGLKDTDDALDNAQKAFADFIQSNQ